MPHTHGTDRNYNNSAVSYIAVEIPETAPSAGDNYYLSATYSWNTYISEQANHDAVQAYIDDLASRSNGLAVSASVTWQSTTDYTPTP